MTLNFCARFCATPLAACHVAAADLDIDGSRRTLVEHCIYQAAGLEVGAQLGKFACDTRSRTSSI